MITTISEPEKLNIHAGRKLSRRYRPDAKKWEMNPKEFRYYESLDMIIPNIL